MKTNKKKLFWKYLLGIGAGCILVCATIGSVVSCSNGSTNTASSTSTNSSQNKNSTTTSSSTSTSNSSTLNNTQTYELMDRYNTATIAYKDSQKSLTNKISMVTTNNDVTNYSKWLNEPNNVIISVLGQPEAVINVKNDTNSANAPDITLSLNPNSTLYQECLNHTNDATDLTNLNNLLSFTTTKNSDISFGFNNNLSVGTNKTSYQNSWTFSLSNVQPTLLGNNNATGIGIIDNGIFVTTPISETLSDFWTNINSGTNPTAKFTTTNELELNNGTQVPFNLTLNLLPLVQYVKAPTTIQVNTKTGTWTLPNMPADAWAALDDNGTWYFNRDYKSTTLINGETVNYIYLTPHQTIEVGTATVKS